MSPLDDELVARAIRWCAEAGRHATAEQVRAALAPLSWDQLLAARALLADPPPARPLGPAALADLARGALPDVAAEREREGRYAPPAGADAPPAAPEPGPAAAPARTVRTPRARRAPTAAAPVVRRARDRVAGTPAPVPALPLVDELHGSEGRAVLERMMRRLGARRGPILAALARGWRRGDGAPPGQGELVRLLDAHGMTRGFERRERDELLHALRAAGGLVAAAAERVGLDGDGFRAALDRLGAAADAEAIRAVHRDELRRRGTLAERARALLSEPGRLADLGLLAEFEADLRLRLPEHVRAVRAAATEPLSAALARSLGIGAADAVALSSRLGVELAAGPAATATARPPAGAPRPPGSGRPRVAPDRSRGVQRTRPSRPSAARRPGPASARPSGSQRPGPPRPPGTSRPRPGGERSAAGRGPRTRPGAGGPPRSTSPARGGPQRGAGPRRGPRRR